MKCLKCPNLVIDGRYRICIECEKKTSRESPVILRIKDAIPSFPSRTIKKTVCYRCGVGLERSNTKQAICLDCRDLRIKENAPRYYKKEHGYLV